MDGRRVAVKSVSLIAQSLVASGPSSLSLRPRSLAVQTNSQSQSEIGVNAKLCVRSQMSIDDQPRTMLQADELTTDLQH